MLRELETKGDQVEHRAQVGVECPHCHWRQFVEVQLDDRVVDSPLAREIQRHLEAWMASRCPDHLGPILDLSKN